jgi:hypothetical protein
MLFIPSNLIFCEFVPFRSILSLVMGFSETHGIPRKEHFFRARTKTVPILFRGIFSEWNFDGNPSQDIFCVKNLAF